MKTKPSINFALYGFVIALGIGAVCTALGHNDFLIYNAENVVLWFNGWFNSPFKLACICGLSLWITYIPFIQAPSRAYSKNFWYIMFLLYPVFVFMAAYGNNLLPVIVSFGAACMLKSNVSIKRVLLTFLEICIITILYEIASAYIKTMLSVASAQVMSETNRLIMCIDYYAVAWIINKSYRERSEEKNAYLSVVVWRRILVLWRGRKAKNQNETHAQSSLSKFDKWFMISMQPVQLILVALAVSINNKLMVFFLAYIAGFLPQKRDPAHTISYHAGTWYGCLIQTVVSFYVVCSALPFPNISMFAPALGGIAFWWCTVHYAALKRGKVTIESIDVNTLNLMISRYPIPERHEWKREIATLSWVDHMTVEQIADKLHTSVGTVNATRKLSRNWIESQFSSD